MTDRASSPRVLAALSNDFGELLNAVSLLSGLEGSPVALLPPRLTAAAGPLTIRTAPYRSSDDILAAVEEERPDVVVLFSGYLFGVNEIFDEQALRRLVRELRAKTCALATSDPFLGVMSTVDDGTFSDRHPMKSWLTTHFTTVSAILADLTHVYVVPPDWPASRRSLSYFNPDILVDRNRSDELKSRIAAVVPIDPSKPRWVFVLSNEDYASQVVRYGMPGLAAMLGERLRDADRAGRQPVLVAPEPCIREVRGAAPDVEAAVLLSSCGHDLFTALLGEAECAFYWNLFSSSIPNRLMNERPFLVFDRGHLARVSEPTFRAGLREYYRGGEVVYLDAAATLTPEIVDEAWRRFNVEGMAEARRHFARSPHPKEMIERLLAV